MQLNIVNRYTMSLTNGLHYICNKRVLFYIYMCYNL